MPTAGPPAPPRTSSVADLANELLNPTYVDLDRDQVYLDHDRAEHRAEVRRLHASLHRSDDRARLVVTFRRHRSRTAQIRARRVQVPSLLDQLIDEIGSSAGAGHRTSRGPSRSPIALDAAELVGEIEREVAPLAGHGPRAELVRRVWSWMRLAGPESAVEPRLAGWVLRARTVLDPPRPLDLVAACPACGARTAWVVRDGERVRQAALQLDRHSRTARCLAYRCGASWGPELLTHLARVIEQQAAEERAVAERGDLTMDGTVMHDPPHVGRAVPMAGC